MDQPLLHTLSGERYRVEYTLHLPLQDGIYAVQVGLAEPMVSDHAASFVDYIDDAVVFSMARWEKAKLWSKVFMFPTLDIEKISKK
jgi:lipopolysaccharide transport system ATP-binding protein